MSRIPTLHAQMRMRVVGTDAAFRELSELRKAVKALRGKLQVEGEDGPVFPLSIDAVQALPPTLSLSTLAAVDEELEALEGGIAYAQRRLAREERLPRPSHKRKPDEDQIAREILGVLKRLKGKQRVLYKEQVWFLDTVLPILRIETKGRTVLGRLGFRG